MGEGGIKNGQKNSDIFYGQKWESQIPLVMVRNGKVNFETTRRFRQIF